MREARYVSNLPLEEVTIAEAMREAGYRTAFMGKWHLGTEPKQSPIARGFDRFYGTRNFIDSYFTVLKHCPVFLDDKIVLPGTETPVNHLHPDQEWYTTDVFTDYALHFMDEAFEKHRDQQIFLYIAHNAPHFPLHAREEETKKICAELISKLGANSVKDMGKVMGELKKLHADEIDFAKAGPLIKELLNS